MTRPRTAWPRRAVAAALLIAATVRPSPAPATIAAQRARLPPAAECADPIEGTWRGLSWYPNHRQWYEFTLEIRRQAPGADALAGTITAHFWDGVPDHSEPGPCAGQRVVIHQPARGSFAAGKVHFGGTSWRVAEVVCGSYDGAYALDQFKGALEPARHEFQSINDWTAAEDDEATVFRRIRCPDAAADSPALVAPSETRVAPPPYQPGRSAGGC